MHQFIKQKAIEIGFDACGIARAEELTEDAGFMKNWLTDNMHGKMHYLERNFEKRIDPRVLTPGTKSVVVVLLNYYTDAQQANDSLKIARYAHSSTDYHYIIKNKLSELEDTISKQFGPHVVNNQYQHSFVDSAPVLERRWAQKAGLGWIGKHTQLISPGIGSYCFIGILFLTTELDYDIPIKDSCGTCTRCIDACPTNALSIRKLDARKCISYQTIENKSDISEEIIPNLNTYIIGCDICADVCPWNKKWAHNHNHAELSPVNEIYSFTKTDWKLLDKSKFNQIFKNSAIKRAGFEKLQKNINFAT